MSFTTATLTGKYLLYDNVTPAQGTVEIIPNSHTLIDPEGNVILSGRVKVKLGHAAEEGEPGADADGWVHDGSFSVTLPSTDDTTVEPATGRQYAVSAKLKHTGLKAVTGIELAANETVDMADVTPVAEAAASFSVFLTAEEYAADMARVAALEGAPAVTKASLGLGSVDNTSDAAKPVSTATQTALDAKLATTAADSTVAAKVNDPASATRVALSATYAPVAESRSGPDVACDGDSLTAGAGATGATSYPAVLQAIVSGAYSTPGVVRNYGVGGETSATIAGRLGGGAPWIATVAGGIIPASGGVQVTLTGYDGTAVAPLIQGTAGVNPVTINGVGGTLTLAGSVYTFTRTTAGTAIPTPRPVAVVTSAAKDRRGDIHLIWMGQNDGTTDATQIIARAKANIEQLAVNQKRYLVLGLSTGSESTRSAMDAQYVAAFGRRFFNVRKHLANTTTLLDAGIWPTVGDETDIRAGTVPRSFLSNYPADQTHLNAAGYARVAWGVYRRMVELGFNDEWGTLVGSDTGSSPTTYMFDDFERADGSFAPALPAIGGSNWIISGVGNATIASGAALGTLTSGGEMFTIANGGVQDGRLRATLRTPGSTAAANRPLLVFRYADVNNYCYIDGDPTTGQYRLRSKIAGAFSALVLSATPAGGDVVEVTFSGSSNTGTVKVNGVTLYTGSFAVTGGTFYGFIWYPTTTEHRWENIGLTAS